VSKDNRKSIPRLGGTAEPTSDYTRAFAEFGTVLGPPSGSGEAVADECPWCFKDKFHVNVRSGLYHCKRCQESGNVTTYLTAKHAGYLEVTTDDHYHALRDKRGIALQTLKRHGLAYDEGANRWLIPFKSREGNVVNIQSYYPNRATKLNKINVPGLPTALYGLDRLSADKDKILFLCEGAFDAIALDYHLKDNRNRYDVVATPGGLKEAWAEHFKGRKVRALYDNDKGGEAHRQRARKLLGESRVAAELRLLYWPERFPEGCDVNDVVRDPQYEDVSLVALSLDHGAKVGAEPKLLIRHGERPKADEKPIDWIWPHHLRCGTYVSFSGKQGTFKSTIALELAARYTTGRLMPTCKEPGMPAGHVLYLHAEDDAEAADNGFRWAGGDFGKWHALPAFAADGQQINVLEHLGEIEETVKRFGIRFVIVDGQNSVVGSPNISTDMGARTNVTNPLHQFAQRLNICLMGIRNEDAEGRAMGPQSFGDIGRCVVRAVEEVRSTPPYCKLEFVKVSDTARRNYPDIPYSVEDRGGSHRVILWGIEKPKADPAAIQRLVEKGKAKG
jgi:hypothetical protein